MIILIESGLQNQKKKLKMLENLKGESFYQSEKLNANWTSKSNYYINLV